MGPYGWFERLAEIQPSLDVSQGSVKIACSDVGCVDIEVDPIAALLFEHPLHRSHQALPNSLGPIIGFDPKLPDNARPRGHAFIAYVQGRLLRCGDDEPYRGPLLLRDEKQTLPFPGRTQDPTCVLYPIPPQPSNPPKGISGDGLVLKAVKGLGQVGCVCPTPFPEGERFLLVRHTVHAAARAA